MLRSVLLKSNLTWWPLCISLFSIDSLLHNSTDIGTTYGLITVLLRKYPKWTPNYTCYHHFGPAIGYRTSTTTFPTTEEERRILRQEDSMTPPCGPLHVIKMLYDEKKAFPDLKGHLSAYVFKKINGYIFPDNHGTICRRLIGVFGMLLYDHREIIASE